MFSKGDTVRVSAVHSDLHDEAGEVVAVVEVWGVLDVMLDSGAMVMFPPSELELIRPAMGGAA